MACMAYLNYFVLIPALFSKKHYVYYFLISAAVIFSFSYGEFFLVSPDIKEKMSNLSKTLLDKYLEGILKYIIFRYAATFAAFTLLKLYDQALRSIEVRKQLAVVKDEKDKMEKEYLKSRVSQNYLLNVVSSLQARAINYDEKLSEKIGKLATVIDYYINHSAREKILLQDEIVFYQSYLELELLKRDEFLILSMIVQEPPPNIELPPLIFEPIIYNACRWVNNAPDAHIKFEFSFQPPGTLVFESKSTIKPMSGTTQYIDNELFDKLERRLGMLFPERFVLERKVDEEYIDISLSLILNEA
jgi:LytS/YehU family sensor histidine kinase